MMDINLYNQRNMAHKAIEDAFQALEKDRFVDLRIAIDRTNVDVVFYQPAKACEPDAPRTVAPADNADTAKRAPLFLHVMYAHTADGKGMTAYPTAESQFVGLSNWDTRETPPAETFDWKPMRGEVHYSDQAEAEASASDLQPGVISRGWSFFDEVAAAAKDNQIYGKVEITFDGRPDDDEVADMAKGD